MHCAGGAGGGGVGVGVEGEGYVPSGLFLFVVFGHCGGGRCSRPCWGSIVVVLFLRGMVVVLGGVDDGMGVVVMLEVGGH